MSRSRKRIWLVASPEMVKRTKGEEWREEKKRRKGKEREQYNGIVDKGMFLLDSIQRKARESLREKEILGLEKERD